MGLFPGGDICNHPSNMLSYLTGEAAQHTVLNAAVSGVPQQPRSLDWYNVLDDYPIDQLTELSCLESFDTSLCSFSSHSMQVQVKFLILGNKFKPTLKSFETSASLKSLLDKSESHLKFPNSFGICTSLESIHINLSLK